MHKDISPNFEVSGHSTINHGVYKSLWVNHVGHSSPSPHNFIEFDFALAVASYGYILGAHHMDEHTLPNNITVSPTCTEV